MDQKQMQGSETRLESLEDIRASLMAPRVPTTKEGAGRDTVPYRPVHRPPMALLCILDDGTEDGEWIRIRGERLVIGRSDGDVRIPHDGMMSSKHAEIVRQPHKGGYRWIIADLGSTNGTFVRVADTPIRHGQEILLGSRRFRFNAAPQGAALLAEEAANVGEPQTTRGWQAISPDDLIPSLIEVTPHGDGKKQTLGGTDIWIGREATCHVYLPDDLMISPRHCRLHCDAKGQWSLENAGSRNGTWVRITKVPLSTNGQFQLGEQRFFVRILS